MKPVAHLLGLLLLASNRLPALDQAVLVSAYQGECREGEFSANLSMARDVVRIARERGSQFLAFPECFLSGCASADAVRHGSRPLEDPELRAFIAASSGHDVVIVIGLARRGGERLFNTALVIHRGRMLGAYDKILLTPEERESLGFSPGSSVAVFEAHGVRFSVLLSADSLTPHPALAARLQGAEILFALHHDQLAASSVDDHRRSVRNGHAGLASQLRTVVIRANTVGTSPTGRLAYGDSFILNPQGEPIAEAGLFRTNLLTATIHPEYFRHPQVWPDLNETPPWLRAQVADLLTEFRPPRDDAALRSWLGNMIVNHRFSADEVSTATGLALHEVAEFTRRFALADARPPDRKPGEPLRMLPYPGGRHPRLGFFDGAVAPQRETKVSVFCPWNEGGYVVADVPEAIFSNLGLTYLAHTHIPTIWDGQHMILPRLEWTQPAPGLLACERELPNGISFGTKAASSLEGVRFELWLRNGTTDQLTGLRVQNCVMLGRAPGFTAQSLTNKVFRSPFAAARSDGGQRWIITGWELCARPWGNALVPCLHADPVLPDCPPGETVTVHGWLSFFEGSDVNPELDRLSTAGVLASPAPGR